MVSTNGDDSTEAAAVAAGAALLAAAADEPVSTGAAAAAAAGSVAGKPPSRCTSFVRKAASRYHNTTEQSGQRADERPTNQRDLRLGSIVALPIHTLLLFELRVFLNDGE